MSGSKLSDMERKQVEADWAHSKIEKRDRAAMMERAEWAALEDLARQGDLVAFWRGYAKYLKHRNIVSPGRQVIYRMAIETANALEERPPHDP